MTPPPAVTLAVWSSVQLRDTTSMSWSLSQRSSNGGVSARAFSPRHGESGPSRSSWPNSACPGSSGPAISTRSLRSTPSSCSTTGSGAAHRSRCSPRHSEPRQGRRGAGLRRRRQGSPRQPYRRARYILCQGRNDVEALAGASTAVVGSSRLERIAAEPERSFSDTRRVVINSNFTYNVLSDAGSPGSPGCSPRARRSMPPRSSPSTKPTPRCPTTLRSTLARCVISCSMPTFSCLASAPCRSRRWRGECHSSTTTRTASRCPPSNAGGCFPRDA